MKKYVKGEFGYWWTVELGLEDIEGIDTRDLDSKSLKKIYDKLIGVYENYNNQVNGIDASNKGLTSLRGCPNISNITMDFRNNNLKTLEGGPSQFVDKASFNIAQNNLDSLEGSPQKIGNIFNCSRNNLKSLEDGPREVNGFYIASFNQLETLEHQPNNIGTKLILDSDMTV